VIVLGAWLSKKINSMRMAAFVLVLIVIAIHGLGTSDIPTIVAILILIVGGMDLARLLQTPSETHDANADMPDQATT
jgi:hypothetical protein